MIVVALVFRFCFLLEFLPSCTLHVTFRVLLADDGLAADSDCDDGKAVDACFAIVVVAAAAAPTPEVMHIVPTDEGVTVSNSFFPDAAAADFDRLDVDCVVVVLICLVEVLLLSDATFSSRSISRRISYGSVATIDMSIVDGS